MPTGPKIRIPERKPRSDSRLKGLPESVQAQIVEQLRILSREKVKAWLLTEHKIQTNVASLSEFLFWWQGEKRIQEASSLATQISKLLVENPKVKLNPDLMFDTGQAIFGAMAVANQDAKLHIAVARELQRAKRTAIAEERNKLSLAALKLEREKFEFNAAKAAMKEAENIKAISNDRGLSDDQKLEAVRRRLFGVIPEEAAA